MPPAVPDDMIWRMTVEEYHTLVKIGSYTDDDPIELLEGWLVPKTPKCRGKKAFRH